MRANNEEYGPVEEVVSELCSGARKEYEIVMNLSKGIHKVKQVFSLALYKVSSLPSAPVASRVEDMPSDFSTNYLDAIERSLEDYQRCLRDVLQCLY
jgi:hypothetical protein